MKKCAYIVIVGLLNCVAFYSNSFAATQALSVSLEILPSKKIIKRTSEGSLRNRPNVVTYYSPNWKRGRPGIAGLSARHGRDNVTYVSKLTR